MMGVFFICQDLERKSEEKFDRIKIMSKIKEEEGFLYYVV